MLPMSGYDDEIFAESSRATIQSEIIFLEWGEELCSYALFFLIFLITLAYGDFIEIFNTFHGFVLGFWAASIKKILIWSGWIWKFSSSESISFAFL